jgi:hypothetical protein
LEPFEGLFILDIVERSFRDILAVTQTKFGDPSIVLTDYKPLQRMVSHIGWLLNHETPTLAKSALSIKADGGAESEGTLDNEYLAALEFLRQTE